jgi:beta-lactamase regulating signal transducer with metallopeptidase domain
MTAYFGLSFAAGLAAKATLLLLAAAIAAAVMRGRAPAAARHLAWTLAVCGILALPLFSLALPGWRLGFVRVPVATTLDAPVAAGPVAAAPAATAVERRIAAAPSATSSNPATTPSLPTIAAETPRPATAESQAQVVIDAVRAVDWAKLLTLAWATGMALVLARMLAGWWSLRRLARRSSVVTDEAWTGLLRDLRWMMDVDRPVTLLRGGEATMPMTWGIRRPAILLPAEADAWPEERRRVVLLHELAHVARHDCLTQTLAALACALYWFHPGSWYAARRLRVERELACDDRVLSAGTRAREYASHLLEVARAFRAPALAGAAAVSMARPSQLEGRLLAVLDHLRNRRTLDPRAAAAAGVVALALVLPLAAARPASAAGGAKADGHARTPAAAAAAGAQERCTLSRGDTLRCDVPARPGERLTLRLADGVSARVVASSDSRVRIRAETGRRMDASAGRGDGGVRVTISRTYGRRVGNEPDLVVEVPRRFDVAATADGGGLEIRGVEGTFTGSAQGGGLAFIDAAGTVRMSAVNGGAYVKHSRLRGRLDMNGGGVMMDGNDGDLDVVGAAATVHGSAEAVGAWGSRVASEFSGDDDAAPNVVRVQAGNVAKDGGPIVADVVRDGVRLHTGGGEIRVRRAEGDIDASTGGGNVTLESVAGDATVNTGSGTVVVHSDGGGNVDVSAGTGRVTVVLPAGYSGAVDVETAYTRGRAETHINSDWPLAVSQTREWSDREGTPRRYVRARGTIGSGRHHVRVRTVNGDVRLVRAGTVVSVDGDRVRSNIAGGEMSCEGNACTLSFPGGSTITTAGSGDAVTVNTSAGNHVTASTRGDAVTVNTSGGNVVTTSARRGAVTVNSSGGSSTVVNADGRGYAYADGDAESRIASMRELARNAPPSAAAQALARFAFGDPSSRVQREAVEALATVRGSEARAQLGRIAREHPDAALRRRAAELLR